MSFPQEDRLAQAIDNAKKQLSKKFNTKGSSQKETWDKLVGMFREYMITQLRSPDVPQVIQFQLEPWMVNMMPSPSHYIQQLIKESFDSDEYLHFLVKTVGYHCIIYVDVLKLLPIMERYHQETGKKRKFESIKPAFDIESGMSLDEEDDDQSNVVKEDAQQILLQMVKEFIKDNIDLSPGVQIEDYTIYSCWCTWCYERDKRIIDNKLVLEGRDRPGRRSFMTIFLKEANLEKKIIKKRTMINGLRVRATPQTPWLYKVIE